MTLDVMEVMVGVLDDILGVGSFIEKAGANLFNAQSVAATNRQNEQLMRDQWARDDTAVQRRVADLKAAGLNPVLAAGSAAGSSGAPITMRPQEMSGDSIASGAAVASAMKDLEAKNASIAQTRAQTALTEKQAEGVDVENKLKIGTLQPKISEAAANATVAAAKAKWAEWNADQEATLLWAEKQLKTQSAALGNVYTQLKAQVMDQVVKNEITEAQGKAVLAVAVGKMATQSQEFFQKIGVTPDMMSLIGKALGGIIDGAMMLAK